MEPKFIITLDGYMRIGQVRMHKDLLQPHDTCIGGGFWEIDYASMRLLLTGKSFDYGKPKWPLVTGKFYVPSAYRGMQIEYTGSSLVDYHNLLTSSLCHPKFFVKEFCYFLMSCHQHCLGVNLLVQR